MNRNKVAMLYMFDDKGTSVEHRVVVADIPQMELEAALKEQCDFKLRGVIEFYDSMDRKKIAEDFSRSYGWAPNENSRTIHYHHSSCSAIPIEQGKIIIPAFVNYFGPVRPRGFLSRFF